MSASLRKNGYADAFLRPVFHGVGMEHEEAPIPGGHAVIHGEAKVETVEAGMVALGFLEVANNKMYLIQRRECGLRDE